MSALLRLATAQARRRRVQSAVVAVVALLATATGVLALNLRTLGDAPYDHAFDAQAGAHLTVAFAPGRVSTAQLAATALLPLVAAAAGPWPQLGIALDTEGGTGCAAPPTDPPGKDGGAVGCGGRRVDGVVLVGRTAADGPVDRLAIVSGRWPVASGEVALRRLFADTAQVEVGSHVVATTAAGATRLTVTGLVAGVDADVDGWTTPAGALAMAAGGPAPDLRMVYRLHAAANGDEVAAARSEIAAAVPAGALESAVSWLDVRRQRDLTVEVMAPFLLAFSVLGVGAVFLIVVNVIGGAVVAGRRDIGVMKAVGFTPAGVTACMLVAMLLPALVGTLVGVGLGVIVSQPLLAKSAEAFDVPYTFGASTTGIALVVAAMLATVGAAAAVPAWRAGRAATAEALASGRSPRGGGAAWLWRRIAALPLPRPLALGAADSVVRPARSMVTSVAVVVGVSAVVFATGLTASLRLVEDATAGPANAQVNATLARSGDPAATLTSMRAQAGVARLSAAREVDGSVPGVTGTTRVEAWEGDASWLGYAVIAGRWIAGPDEVVLTSGLQRTTGLQLGDRLTLRVGMVTLRPVVTGVVFGGNASTVHVDARSLPAAALAATPFTIVDIGVAAGSDPAAVAGAEERLDGVHARVRGTSQDDTAFAIIEGVLVSLTLVVTAVAALGVFNTVVLSTRERRRHLAVLRAIGMEPRQVVTMVVTGTALLGLVAGAAAIPVGMALHRGILAAMADIAGTDIPASFYAVYERAWLPLLALCGVGVAALGAALPARWIAREPAAEALRAE